MKIMGPKYNSLTRFAKGLFRIIFPIPKSPWTTGPVENICAVNLVPPEKLVGFFQDCLMTLESLKGKNIGDYLEFGVFNGNSIGSMYLASKAENLNMRLFGFDAFEGLPAQSENEDDGVWKKGFYHCSFEQMKECLKRRNINPDQITWINGWYQNTLNSETITKYNLRNLGIVFIDCDTYSSSKAVLDFIGPLIKSGNYLFR